ncbi:trypsin-like peptidase domain-containing protein [Roseateles sp. DAIF2]|uniref:S1 family peptidase n=1 Tax=Roseateles sp. DAIF2 TaxID=2714952 RepID=UPI0018A2AFC7|nr:serine protease [Roseateles sp. DAIF2]QPF72795.1 trypsin-like peptidase domain-containing protein [Roseateles sp. DAIF2]
MSMRALHALLLVGALTGCASSSQLYTNDKQSETLKSKSFKAYREVLLIPPKEDPRKLIPRVTQEIEGMGLKVRLMDPAKPIEASQGTGFVVSMDGWLLTCAHVMGEQKVATITLNGQRLLADVLKIDAKVDLALLKLRDPMPAGATALSFRVGTKPPAMGEDVFTIGYPLSRILGNNARMSRGLLSATTGLRDDDKQLQVSAEIQPGNSGGPLLDRDGSVIGVVNQTLNPAAVAQSTGGALPQNVNFAVKGAPVLDFLKEADSAAFAALKYGPGAGLEGAGKAVVKVQAGEVGPDSERVDKMVVRFSYVSIWDLWYRFRMFALAAFDYETQEPLFIAGQGHDNVVSNEDVVIRDTLDQFRKAISSR